MSGTLYSLSNVDFRAHKILIAAQYSGNNVSLDPNFVPGETDKSAAFLKKFPFGKVPAYECGDVKLFQTNAIAYYVGNDQTRGGDNEAEVLQWIGFADNTIEPAACTWVYPTMGILQYNKTSTEKAKSDIKAALCTLNDFLASRTFLVGERVTQADISLACTLCMLYVHVMDPEFRKPFGNVTRWFVTLINQPQFKAVLGDIKLCEKMGQFDSKKYNEIHGKADKKEKTPKQKGGAGDSKSPAPKKAAKPESDASAPPVKQEKKDPWGHLPATNYDFDEFKRCYSNDKDPSKKESLKYFWDHFDKEKYSIWRGRYNYDDEFRQEFMAMNLVNGMFQRLEKMRKHSFGVVLVLKKGSQYTLDGMWFWRGKKLSFTLDENWQIDYESYNWKSMDSDANEAKSSLKEYFAPTEGNKIDGWEIVDWNVFK